MLIDCGIDFEKLSKDGIEHSLFAEYFIQSGLILMPDIHWYGFHTDHDFAYLLRVLSGDDLPPIETKFLEDLHYYFPNIYDIKTIADAIIPGGFTRSLALLSQILNVKRDDNNEH